MKIVNIHEAKTHLSSLITEAMNGEEIIIAKSGKPYVSLTPIEPRESRKLGIAKGKFSIDESFFDPLPESELEQWEK